MLLGLTEIAEYVITQNNTEFPLTEDHIVINDVYLDAKLSRVLNNSLVASDLRCHEVPETSL